MKKISARHLDSLSILVLPLRGRVGMGLLIVVTLSLSKGASAQPFVNIGAGIETTHAYPLMKLSAGYQYRQAVIEVAGQAALTRQAGSSNYGGVRLGYNIHNFVPCLGYYYNYISADNKELNHAAGLGYSLKYIYEMGEPGGLYAEAMYIEKAVQVTVGFHVNF